MDKKVWSPWRGHFWDGITRPEHVPNPQALSHRRRLFEAAERGDWEGLFQLLDESQERTLNMVSPGQPSSQSPVCQGSQHFYTLLHHAARANAPVHVVESLLARGHFCSHRCAAGERPVDIARRLGHHTLVELLDPPRRQGIPESKLAELEKSFHRFILQEVGSPQRTPRLPPLELLLELDEPMMTFLVPYRGGGFHYRLEQVAFPCGFSTQPTWILLTMSYIHMFQGSEARYVITSQGALLLAEPIID